MFLGKTVNFHNASLHAGVEHPIQGGVEIMLAAACCRNRDTLLLEEPLGSYADFSFLPIKFIMTIFNAKANIMSSRKLHELLIHFLLRARQNFNRTVTPASGEMGGQESTIRIR